MTSFMVCATRQHVGKTSVSMALLDCLRKARGKVMNSNEHSRIGERRRESLLYIFFQENKICKLTIYIYHIQVGYMKPVGQMWVDAPHSNSVRVDKDVVLAKEHFDLRGTYQDMSPMLIPRGQTKSYLDGHEGPYQDDIMESRLKEAYNNLYELNDGNIVVEGTGHCAVGSVVGWNNARVAATLGLKIVLIANGGIGSTFDELVLNRVLCESMGVEIAGIVVNKVKKSKVEQTREYLEKAMIKFNWNVPILGVVPDGELLDRPCAADLGTLFGTTLRGNPTHAYRTIDKFELVTTSLEKFMEKLERMMTIQGQINNTAFVTHRSRADIVQGLLAFASRKVGHAPGTVSGQFQGVLLLSGDDRFDALPSYMDTHLKDSVMPVVLSNHSSTKTMSRISSFTPKLTANAHERVRNVIKLYSPHICLDELLNRL